MRTYFVVCFVFAVAAQTGCKKKSDESSAASSSAAKVVAAEAPAPAVTEAPAPTDTGGPLAIDLPADAEIRVPGATIERAEPVTLEARKKQRQEEEYTIEEATALADGWSMRDEDGLLFHRSVGGHSYNCQVDGTSDDELRMGREVCGGFTASGDRLRVPFRLGSDGEVYLNSGGLAVYVHKADESTPATADAFVDEAGWKQTGKVLMKKTFPGGYSVVMQGRNGDIESQNTLYLDTFRTKIGALDLVCESPNMPATAEESMQVVELCRSLAAL